MVPNRQEGRMYCTHPPTTLSEQVRGRMRQRASGQRVSRSKVLTTCMMLSDKHQDFIIIRGHLSEICISNFKCLQMQLMGSIDLPLQPQRSKPLRLPTQVLKEQARMKHNRPPGRRHQRKRK